MDPLLLRVLVVAALLVAVTIAGRWWRRRDGAVRPVDDERLRSDHLEDVGLDLTGSELGAVLLGTSTCAPCETVKRVLSRLAAERHGFRWVYADAAEHLALAREHRVHRVPTLLLVEPGGRVVARTSGVPDVDELRGVLDGGARIDDTAA